MQCPACGQDNPGHAKFCLECGQRLPAPCAACGHPLVTGGKFCVECGAPATTAPAPTVTATTSATAGPPPAAAPHPVGPDAYTPRHLAEKILAARSAVEGERKPVTVLFCDVVSSTALAGDLGAEGMHGLLNRFFELALGEVHRYEGTINQFLGDGFMALFGAPIAHEDHARRAVLCALDLVRAVETHRFEVDAGRRLSVRVRLGIHTGFVVVGAIGDNLRMDYTAVGDTTHLAARLQQLAQPGTIVVSDVTARLVRGYVRLDALGPTDIRGRAGRVEVFRVVGPGPRRSPLEAIEDRPLSHFVGRDREVGVLSDLFRDVEAGRGQTVGLVGEPGVGKTRLLLEFQRRNAGRDVAYREGRCLSFGSAIPYGPVLDLVRAAAGLVDSEPLEASIDKLRLTLADLGMDAAVGTPFLAHLLGLKDDETHLAGLSPEVIKLRTFETLRQMSVNEARRRPLVLAIEDLHWIDRTSEEYLASLVDALPGAAILLVTTYRPGYRPPWMDRSDATQLSITRLGDTESLRVLRSVLADVDVSDRLASLILDKAEGNPFFVEELARAVGRPDAATPTLAVPDTVHGVLTARIDRLADVPKRVLQTASILGREFSLRLLEAIWDGGGLADHVHELVRQEFLYERADAAERTYVFKHALTQDVAMSTLLAARRRELHLRAGHALAAQSPDRLRELAPLLAHHYYAAEAWPLASEYAARAAAAATAAYANREALERYDQAIGAADRGDLPAVDRVRLRVARAEVRAVLGSFDPARVDLEAALALAADIDTGADAARSTVLGTLAALWGGHKDYTRALELARAAEASAERSGDHRVLAEAVTQRGLMQLNVAALGESRTALEQALALFQEVGDATGHARALDLLSMVNGLEGRVRACGEYATEALRRFRALGDRAPEPSLVTNHGFWLVFAGERARAEPRVRDGLHAAVAVGSRSAEAYAHMALAETNEIYGDFGAALREADEAIAIARAIGHREWTAGALSIVGRVHRLCGDPAGAAVSHEEMLAIDRALGSVLWMAEALGELGLDALEVGDTERGAALMREAIATAPEAMKSIVRYLVALAELALQQGDPSGAVAQARDVQARVPEFRVFIVDAVRVEGEALVALGQEDLGEGTLRRAQIEAITMNAAPATWRACLALASVLERAGRIDEARAERAAARGALDRAARDLPHSLGASFAQSAVVRRAERS